MKQIEELVQQFNFTKIAEYLLTENGTDVDYKSFIPNKIGKYSIVYAITADGEVCYLGKSIAGLGRPLSYHKNDVMVDVRDGINKALSEGKHVEVWVKKDGLSIEHQGLTLDISEALEQSLIAKIDPEWNNHVRKIID